MKTMYRIPVDFDRTEKLLLMETALKVTFVRHPFVRLVSTFQDRVIDINFKDWRQECLKFPSNKKILGNLPNFDQFVEFVLQKMKMKSVNVHLEFFWRRCDLCKVDFDVIGKVETASKDTQYIFNKVKTSVLQKKINKNSFIFRPKSI